MFLFVKLLASVSLSLGGLYALGWGIFDVLVFGHVHGPGTYIFTAGMLFLFVGFVFAVKIIARMKDRERQWSLSALWVLVGLVVCCMGLEGLGVHVFGANTVPTWTPGPEEQTQGLLIIGAGLLIALVGGLRSFIWEREVPVVEEVQS